MPNVMNAVIGRRKGNMSGLVIESTSRQSMHIRNIPSGFFDTSIQGELQSLRFVSMKLLSSKH